MRKHIGTLLGFTLGLVLGFTMLLASPASATDEHFPTTGWEVRDASGIYPAIVWNDAAESVIVDASTVELTKPSGDVGTSIETTNLGLDVSAGDVISVDYVLSGGADTSAGAIRMFYYDHVDGDTLFDAPTSKVDADGSGTLELEVLADGTIGTLGLTYDASNVSYGTVTFSSLQVDYTNILFIEPVVETPTPTPAEITSPTPGATGSPSASPTETEAPVNAAVELPKTGSNLPLKMAGGAVLLGGLGGGLLWFARKRGVPTEE